MLQWRTADSHSNGGEPAAKGAGFVKQMTASVVPAASLRPPPPALGHWSSTQLTTGLGLGLYRATKETALSLYTAGLFNA